MLKYCSLFCILLSIATEAKAQQSTAQDSSDFFYRHTIQMQFGSGFYISNSSLNAFPTEEPSSLAFNISWGYSINQHWAIDITLQSNAFKAINPWTSGEQFELPESWKVVGYQDYKQDERNGQLLSSGMIVGAVYNTFISRQLQFSMGGGIGFISYGNLPEYSMYFKELNTTNRGQLNITNKSDYSEFMLRIKPGIHFRRSTSSRLGIGLQCSYDYSITHNAIDALVLSNSEAFKQIGFTDTKGHLHHLSWLGCIAVYL